MIDHISARALLFLRDASDEMNLPIKNVIVEHIGGLALVMGAAEGEVETRSVLDTISQQL
ncbi:MAG: hypothetical protein ACJAYG_001015 [Oceanicoccus sp.]